VIDLNELSNELVNAFVVIDWDKDLSKVPMLDTDWLKVKYPVTERKDEYMLDIDWLIMNEDVGSLSIVAILDVIWDTEKDDERDINLVDIVDADCDMVK
jgi:hypothetical protein